MVFPRFFYNFSKNPRKYRCFSLLPVAFCFLEPLIQPNSVVPVEHLKQFQSVSESDTKDPHMAKAAAKAEKPLTKVQIYTNIAEATGLSKKQIAEVFDALKAEIANAVGKKGVGTFVIPDLCKVVRIQKKALPKRQVRNPQTGEMKWADPKPASTSVKVRPLKKLKDMV